MKLRFKFGVSITTIRKRGQISFPVPTHLRNARRPDRCRRRRDGDGDDGAEGDVHLAHLRDEYGGHRLVERGAVHVDGGADGKHESEKGKVRKDSLKVLFFLRKSVHTCIKRISVIRTYFF